MSTPERRNKRKRNGQLPSDDMPPMEKRPPRLGKRQSGFDPAWTDEFPWVVTTADRPGIVTGMLCNICITQQLQGKRGLKVWSKVPCTTFEKESLKKHAKSDHHKEAEAMAATATAEQQKSISQLPSEDRTITTCLQAPRQPRLKTTPPHHPKPPPTISRKRQSGFDPAWKDQYSWVVTTADRPGIITGMLCNICMTQQPKKKRGLKVWSKVPCTTFEKESLKKHAKSDNHKEAEAMAATASAKQQKSIRQALVEQVNWERMAFLAALRGMYWLTKNEIAHTTNFPSLLDMMKGLGLPYLAHLSEGGNGHYTSELVMAEMLKVLAEEPRQKVISDLRASPYFSLLIDETTDIAVSKQLILFSRYLNGRNEVVTSFLGIKDIPDGTADTIVSVIKDFLLSIGVDIAKMAGLGSDGAAVIVGRKNGVATQLRWDNAKLVNVHCVAHKLALAAGQSASGIPYLVKFKNLLGQLYRFYENPAVTMSGLKEIQEIVNSKDDCVKLSQEKDVRWLSHHQAVTALRRTFPAVIKSLEEEAAEKHEAVARGLATFLKTFEFSATLLMLSDVLPLLAKLSKTFQKHEMDFSLIDINVDSTIQALQRLKETPGQHFAGLRNFLEETKGVCNVEYSEAAEEEFVNNIYKLFLDNVIQNMHDMFPDNIRMSSFNVFDPAEADYDQSNNLELLCEHYGTEVSREDVLSEHQVLASLMLKHYNNLSTNDVLCNVRQIHADTMPNMARLAAAIAVIPVSTADCERSFATMKRVKTALRNQLKAETLNDILMISIEGPDAEDFNFDSAFDNWASIVIVQEEALLTPI